MNDVRTRFHHEPLSPAHARRFDAIDESLALIMKELSTMSQATDDLAAAVSTLSAGVNAAIAAIQAETQKITDAVAGDDGPAIEACVSTINGLAASLQTAVTAANAAVAAQPAAAAAASSAAPPPAASVEDPAPPATQGDTGTASANPQS